MHPHNDRLVTATQEGLPAEVAAALQEGASADARDARGHTALMLACERGDLHLAEFLLDHGASPNRRTPQAEETVLHQLARRHDGTEVLAALLRRPVRIDRLDRYGWTPLMVAAQAGAADNVSVLLAAGADRTLCTPDGRSPATLAEETGHLEVLGLLE